MRLVGTETLLFSVLVLLSGQLHAGTPIATAELQEARSQAKAFGGALKSELKAAIKAGGVINAINVCNLQAGPIADKISSQSGWQVNRTSLKVRNKNNAPDEWELRVLKQFERRKASGENPAAIEHSEMVTKGGEAVYRYMKAIPTADICTACHGSGVDGAVLEKLKLLYPDDQAVGFSVGDLRGAFTLQKSKSPGLK